MNILNLTAILDENVTVIGNVTAYVIKWTHSSVYVKFTSTLNGQEKQGRYLATFHSENFPKKFVAKPAVLPREIENNTYAFV